MLRFIIAILAVLGTIMFATIFWSSLFNPAIIIGNTPISGVLIVSAVVFITTMRLGKK